MPPIELGPSGTLVLTGLTEGKSNKEIAAHMGIAERTVKAHVARIAYKLGIRTHGKSDTRVRIVYIKSWIEGLLPGWPRPHELGAE